MDIVTIKEKCERSSTTPYNNNNKSLKVRVVKVTKEWEEYTRVNGKKSRYLKFIAADQTNFIEGVAYDADTQEKHIKEGSSVALKNYVISDGVLKLTTNTKIFRCEPVVVPESVYQHIPKEKTYTDVKKVQTSPCKMIISVKGTITKEEATKPVKIGSRDAKVRELTLSDNTGEVKISLWDEKTNCPVKCGDNVKIEDGVIKFSNFYGENTISVNALTDVKPIVVSTEPQKCKMLAVRALDDSNIDVIVENELGIEQEFCSTKDTFAKYLNIDLDSPVDMKEMEDIYITPLLPIQCTIALKGNNIIDIQ